ncbi:hypothetical protein BKA62DRAFT_724270 [Auriculariales sp. MPI-PUGE-AT-0066]|nr:hypothetical protein BKA62DRAFT_724270 [Auriculariales sp. MPI-PUGE-AT-0066]
MRFVPASTISHPPISIIIGSDDNTSLLRHLKSPAKSIKNYARHFHGTLATETATFVVQVIAKTLTCCLNIKAASFVSFTSASLRDTLACLHGELRRIDERCGYPVRLDALESLFIGATSTNIDIQLFADRAPNLINVTVLNYHSPEETSNGVSLEPLVLASRLIHNSTNVIKAQPGFRLILSAGDLMRSTELLVGPFLGGSIWGEDPSEERTLASLHRLTPSLVYLTTLDIDSTAVVVDPLLADIVRLLPQLRCLAIPARTPRSRFRMTHGSQPRYSTSNDTNNETLANILYATSPKLHVLILRYPLSRRPMARDIVHHTLAALVRVEQDAKLHALRRLVVESRFVLDLIAEAGIDSVAGLTQWCRSRRVRLRL